ncbi:MAG: DUF4884 domain-containing protein [Dysgonomonas sp.]
MKRLSFLSAICMLFALSSCYTGRPVAKQVPQNNNTYKVDYLFEHDGCKVYRFYDMGNYVYFTNCTGEVTAISNDSTAMRIQTMVKSK